LCVFLLWVRVVMFIAISVWKLCSVRLCIQLFVGGLVSCLGLFAYSGVQHIFALFFFVVCALCCRFLCIVRFLLPLWYSQTFIVMTARWVSLTLNTFRTRQKQCEQNHSLFAFKVVNQLFGCWFLFLLLLFFVHNSWNLLILGKNLCFFYQRVQIFGVKSF